MYVAKITYIFVCMCVYMCLSNSMALYQTCPLVSFPDLPPPFRRFYLDRGAEEGSGNIAMPFLYRGGGVTDE